MQGLGDSTFNRQNRASQASVWATASAIGLLFGILSLVGIGWGLPGSHLDSYLFGEERPWSGDLILRLVRGEGKFEALRGADVDMDPLSQSPAGSPIHLTATVEDVARIYMRFRLYTNQPDEMITMMALAGMRPSQLQLDPKLYQYGGLYIYPVGALIRICGALGWIEVRNDVAFYLDHPDEFAKFYVVARAYSAAWGVMGVFLVFGIAGRLGGIHAGWVAALLFSMLPVVVCMAHEAKPHLPGAVLMLAAVYFGFRQLEHPGSLCPSPRGPAGSALPDSQSIGFPRRGGELGAPPFRGACFHKYNWLLMNSCCGAAVGMVLSSAPILVLSMVLPFLEWRAWRWVPVPTAPTTPPNRRPDATRLTLVQVVRRVVLGLAIAVFVYLITNPYVLINLFVNREVLRSNFGNSLAMYQISRIGEGFVRVLQLTSEGAALPTLILGVAAGVFAWIRRSRMALPLAIPAILFFAQFVLIGAGKPGEYGRFGVFTNTALAIGTACLLTAPWAGATLTTMSPRMTRPATSLGIVLALAWTGCSAAAYLRNFCADTTPKGTRTELARRITESVAAKGAPMEIGVLREPAPYCCPPLNFARTKVILYRSLGDFHSNSTKGQPAILLEPVDSLVESPIPRAVFWQCCSPRFPETLISWANKPFEFVQ